VFHRRLVEEFRACFLSARVTGVTSGEGEKVGGEENIGRENATGVKGGVMGEFRIPASPSVISSQWHLQLEKEQDTNARTGAFGGLFGIEFKCSIESSRAFFAWCKSLARTTCFQQRIIVVAEEFV
jgi:hypothetical protein